MKCILVLSCFFILEKQLSVAFAPNDVRRSHKSNTGIKSDSTSRTILYLNSNSNSGNSGNGGDKFRVITPDNINSLFGSQKPQQKRAPAKDSGDISDSDQYFAVNEDLEDEETLDLDDESFEDADQEVTDTVGITGISDIVDSVPSKADELSQLKSGDNNDKKGPVSKDASLSSPSPAGPKEAPNLERKKFNRAPAKMVVMDDDDLEVRIRESSLAMPYGNAVTPASLSLQETEEGIEKAPTEKDSESKSIEQTEVAAAGATVGAGSDAGSDAAVDSDYEAFINDLGKAITKNVGDSMSIAEAPDSIVSPSRVFSYRPEEYDRPDPMRYGAYRRWQPPADGSTSSSTTSTSSSSTSSMTGSGSSRSGSGNAGGSLFGKKKSKGSGGSGKKKGGNARDSFYKAIKNLGSGPVGSDTPSTTGVLEPSDGRKPIQPKKAPTGKNKKRVITPDEINSLFGNSQAARNTAEEQDDDEDGDYYDEDAAVDDEFNFFNNNKDIDNNKDTTSRSLTTANSNNDEVMKYSIQGLANEEIPSWLSEGDKEAKQARKAAAMKGRRKEKKLTDDWRFWAAIIVTGGFLAAGYSAFQQTGGFGAAGPAGTFGGGGAGGFGNGFGSDNNPEMII